MRSSPSADAPRRPAWLTARPFAHRGLHGPRTVENSRAAFQAAIAAGEGIELDVRACADGTAFVLHDAEMGRLCEAEGPIAALSPEAADAVRLRGCGETLPRLDAVLALVGGRVPVLIEIKAQAKAGPALCASVARSLEPYAGPAAIMSFDVRLVRWFRRRRPAILRGLVIGERDRGKVRGRIERHLAVRLARPDFLAYDVLSLPSPFAARARERGLAVLAWTVRTKAEAEAAARHADQIIHELPAAA